METNDSFTKERKGTPARKIAISFLWVILIGSILLWLPISNRDGHFLNYMDALFTATSATCVTGLVTHVTVEQFNMFGQVVLMVLMQIGGIGLMTLVATFLLILKNKLSLNDTIALKEMLNQSNLFNFRFFIKGLMTYVFLLEGIGMLLLMLVFIPKYDIFQGIFKAAFISISAFCNAGFDNLGAYSLIEMNQEPLVLITVMILIIMGGIGFIVWFDVHGRIIPFLKKQETFKQFLTSLTLHTKIVIIATLILIFVPAILFFLLEFQNPLTLGSLSFSDKIINALFTSVTLRTAGFASLPMENFQMASKLLMLVGMFIGGSPGGTAGGVKTTTVAVIIICTMRSLRGKRRTNMFNRHISRDIIVRATSIVTITLATLLIGVFALCITEEADFMVICYEACSALATVGLSLGITPYLTLGGKIVIIILMYVGRIGIMTFIMSIVREDNKSDKIHYAEGHIVVG